MAFWWHCAQAIRQLQPGTCVLSWRVQSHNRSSADIIPCLYRLYLPLLTSCTYTPAMTVLLLVLLRWLPESPRYLLANGDAAGAAAVLQQIARINGRPPLQLQHLVNPDQQVTTAAASSFTSSSSAAAATLLVTAAAPAVLEEQQQRRRRHSHLPPLEVSSPPTSPDSEREGLLSPNTSSSTSPSPTDTTTSDQQQQHGPSTSDFPHTRPQHKSSAAFDSSQPGSLKVLAAEVQQALGTLWGGAYASSTTLLLLSWLCVACAYYGLVQLDGQLHIQAAGAAAGGAAAGGAGGTALACADGKLQVGGHAVVVGGGEDGLECCAIVLLNSWYHVNLRGCCLRKGRTER